MINLLPPDVKSDVLYARRNTILLKWIVAAAIGIVGIFVVIAFGYVYLTQQVNAYTTQLEDGRQKLKIQKLDDTQKQVAEISGNMQLVVNVLSREILFSKVLRQIGASIPSGAVLTELTIDKVSGGIDLTFEAKDYQTATQIQINLQDPSNMVFDKADIEQVRCSESVEADHTYPCEIEIRALFGDKSPYLFINAANNGAKP